MVSYGSFLCLCHILGSILCEIDAPKFMDLVHLLNGIFYMRLVTVGSNEMSVFDMNM